MLAFLMSRFLGLFGHWTVLKADTMCQKFTLLVWNNFVIDPSIKADTVC